MRVRVDDAACEGHGRCYALASQVFEADDHGHSIVAVADVGADLEDAARRAAENCPESAITVEPD